MNNNIITRVLLFIVAVLDFFVGCSNPPTQWMATGGHVARPQGVFPLVPLPHSTTAATPTEPHLLLASLIDNHTVSGCISDCQLPSKGDFKVYILGELLATLTVIALMQIYMLILI